jgi:hypothetical protein
VSSVPLRGAFPASLARTQIFPVNGLATVTPELVATAGAAVTATATAETAPTTKTSSDLSTLLSNL